MIEGNEFGVAPNQGALHYPQVDVAAAPEAEANQSLTGV